MDFDTNWDVEKYKSPFECDEHWELRRNFLLAHKDKYPEDRLVCLAQVFFNLEFLGCKYPQKTMDLVAELSEGIADSFREKKQRKIQRTFVKASDAAGARLKGLPQGATSVSPNSPGVTFVSSDSTVASLPKEIITDQPSTSSCQIDTPSDPTKEIISVSVANFESVFTECNPFEDLVLLKFKDEEFFEDGTGILSRSFAKKKINLQYSYLNEGTVHKPIWNCSIKIWHKVVSTAVARNKQISRKAAAEIFLNSLHDICFTLEEKHKILSDGSEIDKNITEVAPAEVKLSDVNNIGSKMMKLMGWKGGGLGKTEQGRAEPVTVKDHVKRSGLGVNLSQQELMKKLRNKLKTFAKMDTNYDLIFSNDFTKEERANLHGIAQKLHLKTRSYGSGNDRHLVVSKKITNHRSMIEPLLNCGGENERYKLIPPGKMELDF